MIFEALMTALLAYQVMMPQVNNAKYTFQIDRDGTIVRMNTQDGQMERCTPDLVCGPMEKIKPELDYKY